MPESILTGFLHVYMFIRKDTKYLLWVL